MDFAPTEVQRRLVAEVDEVLGGRPWDDPREAFARLGARRLLAVHYPPALGGRALGLADHAVVAEHLGLQGLPDEVHLVTVQGVGCTLLTCGSLGQQQRWLPALAGGRVFASLLLSERGAGSDVTAVATTARPTDDGYRLNGCKSWNLRADWSGLGLCSARTRESGRYDSISLLAVPLDSPGVTVTPVARAMGEPYFDVAFDDVALPPDAVVGPTHRGWSTIVRAIGFERAGFDYLSRAIRWLEIVESAVVAERAPRRPLLQSGLARLDRQVRTARALAFRAVSTATGLDMDEVDAAYAKLACSEAAQNIAWWAADNLDLYGDPRLARLRQAVAEAPEFTVSGGATELQLDLIAGSLQDLSFIEECELGSPAGALGDRVSEVS